MAVDVGYDEPTIVGTGLVWPAGRSTQNHRLSIQREVDDARRLPREERAMVFPVGTDDEEFALELGFDCERECERALARRLARTRPRTSMQAESGSS